MSNFLKNFEIFNFRKRSNQSNSSMLFSLFSRSAQILITIYSKLTLLLLNSFSEIKIMLCHLLFLLLLMQKYEGPKFYLRKFLSRMIHQSTDFSVLLMSSSGEKGEPAFGVVERDTKLRIEAGFPSRAH